MCFFLIEKYMGKEYTRPKILLEKRDKNFDLLKIMCNQNFAYM